MSAINIVSYSRITKEQALSVQWNHSVDIDECLTSAIYAYHRGSASPSLWADDSIASAKAKVDEYTTAYETMQENDVKIWNYRCLNKADMAKERDLAVEAYDKIVLASQPKQYGDEDLANDLSDIWWIDTDSQAYPHIIVSDIGDAYICVFLDDSLTTVNPPSNTYNDIIEYAIGKLLGSEPTE